MKHKAVCRKKTFSPWRSVRHRPLYQAARKVCAILQKQGFEAYIVGGAVRDLVRKPEKLPKDLDIATSARPFEITKIFYASQSVGIAFLVCLVRFHGFSFEVATFRKEADYQDQRHPNIILPSCFLQDSLRRDFTVNSLYLDPVRKKLKDPHGGLRDLSQHTLRCVGSAHERLQEDPLRIIRLCRFAASLSFSLEEATKQAARETQKGLIGLSKERIVSEFQKVEKGRFSLFMQHLCDLGNLPFFWEAEDLPKRQRKVLTDRHDTCLPFFNFIKHLFCFYHLEEKEIKFLGRQIKAWPIENLDKKTCLSFVGFSLLVHKFRDRQNRNALAFTLWEKLVTLKSFLQERFLPVQKSFAFHFPAQFPKDWETTFPQKTDPFLVQQVIAFVTERNREKQWISFLLHYLHFTGQRSAESLNIKKVVEETDNLFKSKTVFKHEERFF